MLELVPALILVLIAARAAFSRDARWVRIVAILVLAAVLLAPVLLDALPNSYRNFGITRMMLTGASGALLFAWGFRSRDPWPWRLASLLIGAAGFAPALFAILLGMLALSA